MLHDLGLPLTRDVGYELLREKFPWGLMSGIDYDSQVEAGVPTMYNSNLGEEFEDLPR